MSELKIGDLVFYKNYFCIISTITPSATTNVHATFNDNKYDKLALVRKFRCDGSSIKKSRWTGWEYRHYLIRPDEQFIKNINMYTTLLEIYKSIV